MPLAGGGRTVVKYVAEVAVAARAADLRAQHPVAAVFDPRDMRVIATKRDPTTCNEGADAVHGNDRLHDLLREADVVALTCPLTPETEHLIDAAALAAMKPTAHLINVARGRVIDEAALIEALQRRRIAAAALDVTREEPLPAGSPLWTMPQVLITPHSASQNRLPSAACQSVASAKRGVLATCTRAACCQPRLTSASAWTTGRSIRRANQAGTNACSPIASRVASTCSPTGSTTRMCSK